MIDSRNEWDPLEAIVVGTATGANWPMTDPVFAEEARTSLWTGMDRARSHRVAIH